MQSCNYKSICNCLHESPFISEVNSKVSLCFKCSCVIFKNKYGQKISTIKPAKYGVRQETSTPIFLYIPDTHTPYIFTNKEDYQKIRNSFVKEMKKYCTDFQLSKKTYFLALDYFDRICSKMSSFELDDLHEISQFCIIFATKFQESQIKAMEMKSKLNLTNNYCKDELFLLQLLDYDLLSYTSYDILMDIMHTGFIFNDEKFSFKKMIFLYGKLENMLYFFSETKYYINMTHKEIALSLIGLIREILGLTAYNDILKEIFMNENTDIQSYYVSLKKFATFFKINDNNNNHSDSSTDSNDSKEY